MTEEPRAQSPQVRDVMQVNEKAREAGRRAARTGPPISAATIRQLAPALQELRRALSRK